MKGADALSIFHLFFFFTFKKFFFGCMELSAVNTRVSSRESTPADAVQLLWLRRPVRVRRHYETPRRLYLATNKGSLRGIPDGAYRYKPLWFGAAQTSVMEIKAHLQCRLPPLFPLSLQQLSFFPYSIAFARFELAVPRCSHVFYLFVLQRFPLLLRQFHFWSAFGNFFSRIRFQQVKPIIRFTCNTPWRGL